MAKRYLVDPPVASAGANDHADWLELTALGAPDGNSSFQDLVAELRRSGTIDAVQSSGQPDARSERSQQLADDAFAQLSARSRSCDKSYPFRVGAQTLSLASADPSDSAYVFLLLLRIFGVRAGSPSIKSAQHFEELATVAALEYLGGSGRGAEAFHFGFPRRTTPAGFKNAVEELCKKLGEGTASIARPSRRNQKDAKLDLVAWRPFTDTRSAKIIAFGQCAAGDNWDGKASELVPKVFTRKWLSSVVAFEPIVFFFVPHCLDDEEWDDVALLGNTVPFDRCRVSSLVTGSPEFAAIQPRTKQWNQYVLSRMVP